MAASLAASSVNFTVLPPTKLNDYVYEVCKPQGRPSIEIVFFHGLQWEASKEVYLTTWLSADGSELWLRWILKNVHEARILLISYDAFARRTYEHGLMDMYLTVENLVESLTDNEAHIGRDGCPVVLVGHCLGGLVIKELCTKLHSTKSNPSLSQNRRERVEDLLFSVKGLFFYACPQQGSRLADKSTYFSKGLLFEDVTTLNKETQRRNQEFCQLRSQYGWETFGIGEGCETTLGQFKNIRVVTEASARHDVDTFFTDSEADHFTVCQPKSMTSSGFCRLSNFVSSILKKDEDQHAPKPDVFSEVIGLKKWGTRIQGQLVEAQRIAILGMGGIGKTTLAKVVYNCISSSFEYSCFLPEVKTSVSNEDLDRLQEEIIRTMSKRGRKLDKDIKWQSLRGKKVLLVLDDVNPRSQVLRMIDSGFSSQSRIIITSREVGFLSSKFRCNYLEQLGIEDSKRLLCRWAFEKEYAPSRYRDHVEKVAKRCGGLPLALEIAGKHLCGEEDLVLWDDVLKRLRRAELIDGSKDNQLSSIIMMSYGSLGEQEKEMFLDIATCFHGEALDVAKEAWSVCGWAPTVTTGLKILFGKGFITFVRSRIQMHEVLRDLGRSIACSNQENFASHSRVCFDASDNFPLLWPFNEGKPAVKVLKISPLYGTVDIDVFRELHGLEELRVLWLDRVNLYGPCHLLPPNLAYMRINSCHWRDRLDSRSSNQNERLLSTFIEHLHFHKYSTLLHLETDQCQELQGFLISVGEVKVLEHLQIHFQPCEELPEPFERLRALKHLRIISCDRFQSIPDFLNKAPNYLVMDLEIRDWRILEPVRFLESLRGILQGVGQTDLRAVHAYSIQIISCPSVCLPWSFENARHARYLTIKDCKRLRYLPDSLGQLRGLQGLEIENCPSLKNLSNTLGERTALQCIKIKHCNALKATADTLGGLQALRHLEIRDCRNLGPLSDVLERCRASRHVEITWYHNWKGLVDTLDKLETLQKLVVHRCMNHEDCPSTVDQLQFLESLAVRGLLQGVGQVVLPLCDEDSLEIADLNRSDALPGIIWELRNLRSLRIRSCNQLKSLPEGLGNLQALKYLGIEDCNNLNALPWAIAELRVLKQFTIKSCQNLKSLPVTVGNLSALLRLVIENCPMLEVLPDTIVDLHSLRTLVIRSCEHLRSIPETLGNLQSLLYLDIMDCTNLVALPHTLGRLRALRCLMIGGCNGLRAFPDTVGELKALRGLLIDSCQYLKSLPDGLGKLQSLKRLQIQGCSNLEAVPDIVWELPASPQFIIDSCEHLEARPQAQSAATRHSFLDWVEENH